MSTGQSLSSADRNAASNSTTESSAAQPHSDFVAQPRGGSVVADLKQPSGLRQPDSLGIKQLIHPNRTYTGNTLPGNVQIIARSGVNTDKLTATTADLEQALQPYLRHLQPAPAFNQNLGDVARIEELANALFGSNAMRPKGWKPTPENKASVTGVVKQYLGSNQAIDVTCMWGGQKTLGVLPGYAEADLSDFMAMQRFIGINQNVSAFHKPGIQVRIMIEDLGERFMVGDTPAVQKNIDRYVDSLRTMANAIAPGVIQVYKESEVLQQRPVPANLHALTGSSEQSLIESQIFLKLAGQFQGVFLDYLRESRLAGAIPATSSDPAQNAERLESYARLKEHGWNGVIPKEQRDYYFDRARNEFGSERSLEEIEARVAAYLGQAYARTKLGLLKPITYTESGAAIPPLKASFVPYPPGTPLSLERLRMEYKTSNGTNSNKKIAPWCGTGGFELRGPRELQDVAASTEGFSSFTHTAARINLDLRVDGVNGARVTMRADLFRRSLNVVGQLAP